MHRHTLTPGSATARFRKSHALFILNAWGPLASFIHHHAQQPRSVRCNVFVLLDGRSYLSGTCRPRASCGVGQAWNMQGSTSTPPVLPKSQEYRFVHIFSLACSYHSLYGKSWEFFCSSIRQFVVDLLRCALITSKLRSNYVILRPSWIKYK